MQLSAIFVLSGAILSASLHVSAMALLKNPLENLLMARQTTSNPLDSIPDSCKPSCSTILSNLEICAVNSPCICSTTNARLLESCVDCLVSYAPTPALISQGQALLDQFTNECVSYPVPSMTVSISSVPPLATIPPPQATVTKGGSSGGFNPSTPSGAVEVALGAKLAVIVCLALSLGAGLSFL